MLHALFSLFLDDFCILSCLFHHLCEFAFSLNQLVRSPAFYYLPLVHDQDLIVVCDGVEAMGNRYDGNVGKLLLDAFLDEVISLHVHVRSRFVQDQDLIFSQQGPR